MVVSHSVVADSNVDIGQASPSFKMPNPGDVFMLSAFGWAVLCFFMVIIGNRLFDQLARMTASSEIREIVAGNQSAMAGIMIIGLIGMAIGYLVLVRYPRVLLASLLLGLTFAGALWPPIHDPAFISRYLIIVYLGVFGSIFVLQNFWKMIVTPYYRLVILYLAWIGLIVLINGFKLRDIWYFATEFVFMLALGLAWIARVNNYDRLIEFNKLIAYLAIPVTLLHMISPIAIDGAISGGRFQSYFERATGFSTAYVCFLVPLFWWSMHDERKLPKQIATVFALIGMALILLSGTRSAAVATIIGIGVLWWVFRSQIFVYLIALAMLGLLAQIILLGNENLEIVASRLQSIENTRLEAWALYANLTMESPIFGYGYDGLKNAVYGEKVFAFYSRYGNINVPGVHNYYLGLATRFGIPALILSCCIFFLAFRTAWLVVFNRFVPDREKKAYIMPAALLTVVAAEGIFEDSIGSTGKGALHSAIFGTCAYLMIVYGRRLLDEADTRRFEQAAELAPKKLVRI